MRFWIEVWHKNQIKTEIDILKVRKIPECQQEVKPSRTRLKVTSVEEEYKVSPSQADRNEQK